MKQNEYNKLCDEAFGKPEKFRFWKKIKQFKKTIICIDTALVLFCIALVVFLLWKPDRYVHNEVSKPVLMRIETSDENGFRGKDIDGKRWIVSCDMKNCSEGTRYCWITYDQAPQKPEVHLSGIQIDYVVAATKCWNRSQDDRMYTGWGHDLCEFDIDRDGVLETCILGRGTTSGVSSYEFSVWNGSICEERIFFTTDHYYAMAFYSEGEQLKISAMNRRTDSSYVEDTIHIVYANGTYTLSNGDEQVELLPDPTK